MATAQILPIPIPSPLHQDPGDLPQIWEPKGQTSPGRETSGSLTPVLLF